MRFQIEIDSKNLVFDSDLHGLKVNGVVYSAGKDGVLIYDQVKNIKADQVEVQLSTNTSTLIPAFRILDISYNDYFDERPVVESQNDITFYWNPSKLAAYYNRYSTDELDYMDREVVIHNTVKFLIANKENLPLPDEYLAKILEPCKLLGFYQGFPIFDSAFGFAKLQSRLGIHVGVQDIMISTPLDQYEADVYSLAEKISEATGLTFSKKKNRVIFQRDAKIIHIIGVKI